MPKHTFRKTDDGQWILQTGESPVNFRNMLYVVWRGPIDNLQEEVITAKELHYNRARKDREVPLDWYNAFAEATGLFDEREPEPPRREPPAEKFVCPAPREIRREHEHLMRPWWPAEFSQASYWWLFVGVVAVSLLLGILK